MLWRTIVPIALFPLGAMAAAAMVSQDAAPSRALYVIFDGSNSMWGELPDASRKIEAAKNVFDQLDPSNFAGREVALRLYGHRRAADCSDTELAVPFAPAAESIQRVAERVASVTPRGKTPITRSLKAALEDFGEREGDILLISDGIETCDEDPCELVRSWRSDGVKIRVHVVGLGLTDLARGAMECIADAAGTPYHDASSAGALSTAIEQTARSEPPPPGEPDPRPATDGAEFRLAGQDAEGNFVPVTGTMTRVGAEPVEVSNNRRYVLPPGSYTLTAGVPTLGGGVYETASQEVEVAATGETRVTVTVPRPPRIMSRFVENGEEVRGSMARAFQDDQEVFGLRPNEEHFVQPGTYEFHAALNQDNDLRITETVAPGEDKILLFEAVQTVRTVFAVTPEGSDQPLRQHQELHQNGELVYKVHWNNGADIRPGVYTLRSEHELTPYAIDNVEVPAEDRQTISLSVPLATARVSYRFNTEAPTTDFRCWLERIDADGNRLVSSRALRCDGSDILLVEGRYRVRPWDRLGDFTETIFDAVTGTVSDVVVPEQ